MSNYTLSFLVEGGKISSTEDSLTADSVEYITAEFDFDESWLNLLKTAVFRVGEFVYPVPLEEDKCLIPHEVLREGILYVSVFGIKDNTRATTEEVAIQIVASGYTVCEPTAPSPDPYNYFLEKVTAFKEEAKQSAQNAARSEEITLTAENNASQILKSAKDIENNVSLLSQSANLSKQSAEAAALAAQDCSKGLEDCVEQTTDNALRAEKAAQTATTTVLNEIESHNQSDSLSLHPHLAQIANEAKQIALGKATSLCFETKSQLENFVAGTFLRPDGITVADLKVGDNLYILDVGVPDYWWDGEKIQPLGAEKPVLTDFYTKEQIDGQLDNIQFRQLSLEEYNNAYLQNTLEAGCIYFVYEEE